MLHPLNDHLALFYTVEGFVQLRTADGMELTAPLLLADGFAEFTIPFGTHTVRVGRDGNRLLIQMGGVVSVVELANSVEVGRTVK